MPLIDHRKLVAPSVLLGLMLWAMPAHAQLGGQPCTPATPCAVTALTPGDYFYYIEESLILGGGTGMFVDQSGFLNALIQTLNGGGIYDGATYMEYFAGWVDFGPTAALLAANITNAVQQTDLNTLTVYQSLGADFSGEGQAMGNIEACNQAATAYQSVLYAIQCTNEAILNLSQHLQLIEVLLVAKGIDDVAHHGYNLNADAQSGANMQTFLTQAAQHE